MTGSHLVYADRLRRGDPRAILEIARHAAAQGRGWHRTLYQYLVQPVLPRFADQAIRRLLGRAPAAKLPDWIDAGFARRTGLAGQRADQRGARHFAEAAREALYDHIQKTPWDRAAHWYSQHAAAFGIEVRHPFLDRRLVEFLFSVPTDRLFRAGFSKPLLRQAMTGVLPEKVRTRRDKTRLGAFLNLSVDSERRSWIERLLAAPLAAELGIFDAGHLRAAWRRNQEGTPGELDGLLWYSISLEIWLREHGTTLGLVPPAVAQSAA
jgi:asparagine synthase (glutamine-hydrolysing)